MRVLRYVNLYETFYTEEGQPYEVLTKENATLPIILNPYKIATIEPYYTVAGRQYKNVSIITYDNGDKFKVVGNYIELNTRSTSNNRPKIGY